MNAMLDHALADERHGARYGARRTATRAAIPTGRPTRERVGALLVEAGLHLMTRGARSGLPPVR